MPTRENILEYISARDSATGKELCDRLGISRQALNVHMRALIDSGQIVKSGSTRGARYYHHQRAPAAVAFNRSLMLSGLDESRVYEEIATTLNLRAALSTNVESIVHYAFTEMLNNAIEHSKTERCRTLVRLEAGKIAFEIRDDGVGVFRSITDKFGLQDEHEAMIELLKGRTTTMPEAHTGEGIFFTAKMADRFVLRSHRIQIEWDRARDDVFVSEPRYRKGTTVDFELRRDARILREDVFSRFAPEEYDYQFQKTTVLVKLLKSEYISRSEAKRLIANLEKFREIEFDFRDTQRLGQGFADEIFRIFANRHPEITIHVLNTNPIIDAMIRHVTESPPER
ncbi:MAG: DUF4325 domain-containing protein [Gammaproteobacteria bacterium]|nr:DUF4325 domain-containing protein [Gammaproteobacteria bacterium]